MNSEERIIKEIESAWGTKNIKIKDGYGFFLRNNNDDFEIETYDLEKYDTKKSKKIGKAVFFMIPRDQLEECLSMSLENVYSEDIWIKESYQGKGLSRILLDESFKILKEKRKPHMALFWKKKGLERLMHQFKEQEYDERIANNPPANYKNCHFLYKDYRS